MSQINEPIKIFISFADEDKTFLKELEKQLNPILGLSIWHRGKLSAGDAYQAKIKQEFEAAKIILLLISPNFLYSEYGSQAELSNARNRHDQGEARVIPILLQKITWDNTPIWGLLPLSLDNIVASSWDPQGDAFYEIATAIRKIATSFDDTFARKQLAYLEYIDQTNSKLRLPDGSQVELERIYVSLRADAMNAAERKAEHDLMIQEIEQKFKELGIRPDQTSPEWSDALRKAIVRKPRMRMIEARNWDQLFGEREKEVLSLAEVLQKHRDVVVLGDPGSGKTTLSRWLVVQHVRALIAREPKVEVLADRVRPGDEANKPIDLGPARLPILIHISDYAKKRWPDEWSNNDITLTEFIGQHHNKLPPELSVEDVTKISRFYLDQGRALIILDGLDEVAETSQRREVMFEINRFIQEHSIASTNDDWGGNRLLLTSRIVGYQFNPLTYLPHYTVEDMDEEAISAFCGAWMVGVQGLKEKLGLAEAQKLKEAIFDHAHPGVKTLAGNPLLLTILADVYWTNANRALPAHRVELFQEATENLFRRKKESWQPTGITDVKQLIRALAEVAYEIHANEITSFTEEGTVRARLIDALKDEEQADAVLIAARDGSGFLVARGEGVYAFLHRSLQEFFAAHYLVQAPEKMVEHFRNLAFDPIWKEPLVLAAGIVNQPNYPNSRRWFPKIIDTLLNMPDPSGEFLPRRELMTVAVMAEGITTRIPAGIGQLVTERLLSLYSEREGRAKSPIMRDRIRQAFGVLQKGPVSEEAEKVLCNYLTDPDFERRYAALDIIIDYNWYTPKIIRALVKVWKNYPDPAVSLLVALEEIPPEHLQPDFLPLRQALEKAPDLWVKIQQNESWKLIIRLLYLPSGSEMRPELINRDSPLTQQIVEVLSQFDPTAALEALQAKIRPLATKPGSAEWRDVALTLSACNITDWVEECLINGQEAQLRPLVGTLDLALDRDRDLAHARARDLTHALTRDRALALDLARARARDRDLAHALALDRARDLEKEIEALINLFLTLDTDETEIKAILDKALVNCRSIIQIVSEFVGLEKSWKQLIDAIMARWFNSEKEETGDEQLTLQNLAELILALSSSDDEELNRARAVLVKATPASELGREVIEQLATLYDVYQENYQVEQYLRWALNAIEHDRSEWLVEWLAKVKEEENNSIRNILCQIIHIEAEALVGVNRYLPTGSSKTDSYLLKSLKSIAERNRIPEEAEAEARQYLLEWLEKEENLETCSSIIEVLGNWPFFPEELIPVLILRLSMVDSNEEIAALYTALARLGGSYLLAQKDDEAIALANQVWDLLKSACPSPEAERAVARLAVAFAKKESSNSYSYGLPEANALVNRLTEIIPEPSRCFTALFEGGKGEDYWKDDYQGIITLACRVLLESHPDLLRDLVCQLTPENLTDEVIIAILAACAEVMPSKLQEASDGELANRLVQAATVPNYVSRRFALTAMSYLWKVTPMIVPALLSGCRDYQVVQTAAIEAAGRFQRLEGDLLPGLIEALTGESILAAYGVANLLGTLAASAGSQDSSLRTRIIEAIVGALKHPNSQKEVITEDGANNGKLEDALFQALFQAAGWQG